LCNINRNSKKNQNKHVNSTTTKESFIEWRVERDKTLSLPKLIHFAIPINLRAGRLPGMHETDSYNVIEKGFKQGLFKLPFKIK